jgi:spore coat polysaccharide biosynthesis protein SpsF
MRAKVGAIIQARMGSRRLPGKVLRQVGGKPLLGYLLERVERCPCLQEVVVATSGEAEDDAVARWCQDFGAACFRGELENVASRFVAIAQEWRLGAFVRLSGDSPLLDAALVERAVDRFGAGTHEVVTNVWPRTFPSGQSVEVVSSAAYLRAYGLMREAADQEHVTTFLYRHPELFSIANFAAPEDLTGMRLTVDTPEDLARFAAIVGLMQRPHWQYRLEEITRLYSRVSDLQAVAQ